MAKENKLPTTREVDKGTALVLEILPAIFGLFGIGWIYSGRTNTGAVLLVAGIVLIWGGYLAIFLGSTLFTVITVGIGVFSYCLLCLVPFIQIIIAAVSAISLSNELDKA